MPPTPDPLNLEAEKLPLSIAAIVDMNYSEDSCCFFPLWPLTESTIALQALFFCFILQFLFFFYCACLQLEELSIIDVFVKAF